MCSYLNFKHCCFPMLLEIIKLQVRELNDFSKASKLVSSSGEFCTQAYWILELMIFTIINYFAQNYPSSIPVSSYFFYINFIEGTINCIQLKRIIWGVLTAIDYQDRDFSTFRKSSLGPLQSITPISPWQQEPQICFCHYMLILFL